MSLKCTMEFTNDPEINCVFCGLGFSSVENVELHIVNNHQSNSSENIESRKKLVTTECKINEVINRPSIDNVSTNNIFKPNTANVHRKKKRTLRSMLKHKCFRCFKRFLHHSTLVIHVHNHQYDTKCRRFKCHKCGFKYSTKQILLRHSIRGCVMSFIPEINKNKRIRSGYCEHCNTTFVSRAYLAMHKRRVCHLATQFHYTGNDDEDTRPNHLRTHTTNDQIMSQMSANTAVTATERDRISSIDSKSKDSMAKDDLIDTHSSEVFSVEGSLVSLNHKYQSSSPDLSVKDSISPVAPEADNQQKIENTDDTNKDNAQNYHWHDYTDKSGQKPFQCEICKKHFSNRSSLSNHIKSHYSSRGQPFVCRDCNQRFVNLITLQDHRREICAHKSSESKSPTEDETKCKSKPTYNLSNFNGVSQVPLWPNSTQTNPVSQPVTCVHCNGVFYDRLELEEHALIKHSDEHGNILCLLCERTFTTNMALRVHLTKSHGFANGGCPGVSQNLPPMPRLDTNYNISDEIPHRKRRRRLFEYDKEYSCENCNRNFSTGQALGNHRRACMNMPNDLISNDNKPINASQNSKLHSIESLIFDNKNIRSASFKDDKNVFLAFH